MAEEKIEISKTEYEDMIDYIERMQETIDILSNQETLKNLIEAEKRINNDEFVKEEDIIT